ncbi:hypothetical protein M8818_001559 [Zalaria obscura]|uniref:Uncharacterized protein n=1 Tax=Zalaria obscura TaxID=2024903 RepID=A0ACC3SPJ5_9PEZI
MSNKDATVRTRILIISDTHSTPLLASNDPPPDHAFRAPLPEADVLIHCGDLTQTGGLDEYDVALDTLAQIDAPLKLVIAGNHDLTLDGEWMGEGVGRPQRAYATVEEARREHEGAVEMWKGNGRARREGVVFFEEGVHGFVLRNGARLTVYASPYTPSFQSWAFDYEHNEDRFNPPSPSISPSPSPSYTNISTAPIPSFGASDQVDVIITHGPPRNRLDLTTTGLHVGCPHLLRALMRVRPLLHCFGHIHEGWGAERVAWSSSASEVAQRPDSEAGFLDQGWREATSGVRAVPDGEAGKRWVEVDVSTEDGMGLRRGKESLLVNAAIMDVEYVPVNKPFLVTVDLMRA